ncbi:MAG: hypothetical protein EBS76_05655 [Actinobacteria bacterium]|nr:hypothetical protein [Actinomycetota bacterium]
MIARNIFVRDTVRMMMKSDVKRLATIFATTVGMLALAGCGGGDLIAEATAKADGACECDNFECTTDFIGWFNEVTVHCFSIDSGLKFEHRMMAVHNFLGVTEFSRGVVAICDCLGHI